MRWLALIAMLFAQVAVAESPLESPRPIQREASPPAQPTEPQAQADWFVIPPNVQAIAQSRRQPRRTTAVRTAATNQSRTLAAGAVCGDPALQGESIGAHPGPGGCGVENAVRLHSVAGVALSTPAVVDCNTAGALRDWVTTGLVPAVGNEGGGVASLRVAAHYACRSRNNQSGARMSEHANGRAIDITGISLRSGREISVLTDWESRRDGGRLARILQAACGPFGTVLGPEADRFHRDHFHFDTAEYSFGSYCR